MAKANMCRTSRPTQAPLRPARATARPGKRRCACASGSSYAKAAEIFQGLKSLETTEHFRKSRQPNGPAKDSTVYTVRIQTANDRKSALDDGNAGVQLCMFGGQRNALLHRVCQLEEAISARDTMDEICEIVGSEGGAACDRLPPRGLPSAKPEIVKQRFQRGSLDEVSFAGPNLGPLEALVIGPESGSWQMDEVIISNSRETLTQRFVCRTADPSNGTVFLTPLPNNAVVWGSGDQAVLMTPAQAETMRRLGMRQYQALKQRIFRTTAALVLAGIAVAAAAGGTEAAEAFILGGAIAFIYQLLLNRSVDSLPLGSGEVNGEHLVAPGVLGEQALAARGGRGPLQRMLSPPGGSSVSRLVLTGALMLGAILATQMWDGVSGADEEVHQLSIILTTLIGFGTYKVALVAATLSPDEVEASSEKPVEKM